MDDILKLYEKVVNQNSVDDDEDVVAEIIKAGLIVKVKSCKAKEKIEHSVEYMEQSECKKEEL